MVRWPAGWLVGKLLSRLVGWLVVWLADWLASWLSSRMTSLLALLAQIAWLRLDGLLGSLVGLLTWCKLPSPLPLIARSRMIFGLVHSLINSFVRLETDRNILHRLFTCSLAFFVWLYLLSVSAWFATALLSLGTRLGSPSRHFYGGAHRAPPIKILGGELWFACSDLLR